MRLIDADEMLKEGYTQVTKNELNKYGEWVLVARPIATFPTVAAEPIKHQDTESWRTTATEGVEEYAPIKHGTWIKDNDEWWHCSECGQEMYSMTEQDRNEFHRWCSRCGARMDGGENG